MRFRWETAAVALVTVLVVALAAAEPLRNALTGPHAASAGLEDADLDALDLAEETLALEPDDLPLEAWEERLDLLLDEAEAFLPGDPAAFMVWYAVAYAADIVEDDATLDAALDAMADLIAVDPGLIELVEEPAWKAALSDYLPTPDPVTSPEVSAAPPAAEELPLCIVEQRMVSSARDGAVGNVVGEFIVNEPCRRAP